MALIEGITGLFPGKRGRNAPGEVGLSELGQAVLLQEAGGRYTELAWNGLIYTLTSGLVATPAAGPLGAGGTPLLALWNPLNSGMIAMILRILGAHTATGTVSPKALAIDVGPTAAITQATITRGVANYVGAAADNDMPGFTNVALTGSTALARLRAVAGSAIGNAVAQNTVATAFVDEVSGAILLPPGTVMAITALVAGTANEAMAAIEYAKLRIT
jgi:hypothetical protein